MSQQTTDLNEPPLTDHAYDGIQEYDNPTPGWWTWIFVGTIFFSVIYFFLFTITGGELSPIAFYDRALIADQKNRLGELGNIQPDDATVLRLSTEDRWMNVGKSLFVANCVSCHGRNAEGNNGPNLTDEAFLWVNTPADLVDIIANGRNNGAMPGWSNRLDPREQILVASYVASLRGQNVPGRQPEGKPAPKWE
jgi:cytochrome c oxidase cbb3-type subunit 3